MKLLIWEQKYIYTNNMRQTFEQYLYDPSGLYKNIL